MHFLITGKPFTTLLRFLVFIFLLANIGCQKENSLELPVNSGSGGFSGGSAKYALVPSGSGCSDAIVAGSFVVGVDLGLDAELTVTVDVTTIGDWTYSTQLVNGFVFAGAGIFTATGKQVITLMAAGKPTKAGNTAFSLVMGGANCSFTVPVAATGGGGTTLGEYYYKATIEGVNYAQDATDINGFEAGSSLSGQDDVIIGGSITSITQPLPAGKTDFGIDKGVMHNYLQATQAQFKAFFPVGSVPYAPTSFSAGDGVKIYWTDPSGVAWETRNETIDQFGSTFKILSVQDIIDLRGDYYLKVKVEFKCKLFNSAGASKQLTNGEAVVAFGML